MRGFPRGPQAHPGLRGKVEAGFQLSAWGRAGWEFHCLSPSSASYVPEDLCERGVCVGEGTQTAISEGRRDHMLVGEEAAVGVGSTN